MIETRTRPLAIYPNNDVFFHYHYRKWDSEAFLKKHGIPLVRKEDKEIFIDGCEGVCYSTARIFPENQKKKLCIDCKCDISGRQGAKRCLPCYINSRNESLRKSNKKRGCKSDRRKSRKVLMTTYNSGGDIKKNNSGDYSETLDDLSWTGSGAMVRLNYE